MRAEKCADPGRRLVARWKRGGRDAQDELRSGGKLAELLLESAHVVELVLGHLGAEAEGRPGVAQGDAQGSLLPGLHMPIQAVTQPLDARHP